jgi:hypothetical protein
MSIPCYAQTPQQTNRMVIRKKVGDQLARYLNFCLRMEPRAPFRSTSVPAELVPGALEAFPAPLGSFLALLRPAALAGPDTPLIAVVPAPAEPALGEAPVAAPEAPPADDPPAEAPPPDEDPPAEPPPPPPPPPLCARTGKGDSRAATRITLRISEECQRDVKQRVPQGRHESLNAAFNFSVGCDTIIYRPKTKTLPLVRSSRRQVRTRSVDAWVFWAAVSAVLRSCPFPVLDL